MSWYRLGIALVVQLVAVSHAMGAPLVYVVLWFDTEDYILPASDDAALRIAEFLTKEGIRGTFKIVGEKARTLERRGRTDVIEALRKHEIGYHSNYHSVQPTPAMYLSNLGWDEGVEEFSRREKEGFEDVKRIFGQTPSCYGQPGSSWGPQSYGAIRRWGMKVYLDAGSHVRLDDKPHYYCGILNLYKLKHLLRSGLGGQGELETAKLNFANAREEILKDGGGVVSTIYHPCEFVHKQFWDGVNFKAGANPPRDKWVLPPAKSDQESREAYAIFEDYIRFMKRFQDVRFVTASEMLGLYPDRLPVTKLSQKDVREIAARIDGKISYVRHGDLTLSASEWLSLLGKFVESKSHKDADKEFQITESPLGPTGATIGQDEGVEVETEQFLRTAADVNDSIRKHGRVPSVVWIGSKPVSPEMFAVAIAELAVTLADGIALAPTFKLRPASFSVGEHVALDNPRLWGWVIFPPGFRAPAMMHLARRQAWTLKPALLRAN